MCPYRKTIYQCNHTVVSPSPIGICEFQVEYDSGQRSEPCNIVQTHGRNSIKIAHQCSDCQQRKQKMDKQFVSVKTRIAELRKELEKKYDLCKSHMDEVGVEPEEKPSSMVSTDTPDPTQEFLTKKMQEEDAHLMMFWDYR
ncbi:hypothetical protein F4776DRAFT_669979 [Hypoxylon sp. NC0597]|nr:hypothetical protein F4776DRAFT_669979 [Hypoxylon sp. NC0597]